MLRRFHLWMLLPLLLAGCAVYWFAQAPVGSGIYPARLGGARFIDGPEPEFGVPIIWVRPHPWATRPPTLQFAALTGDAPHIHEHGSRHREHHGDWGPTIEWSRPTRPAWLQPRVQHGFVRLRFPDEGMTATGVRWRVQGEAERRFQTGEVRLVWAPVQRPPVNAVGWANQFGYPHTEPGKSSDMDDLIGHYLTLEGYGRVLDVLSSLPGATHPITNLRYREGREELGLNRLYYEDPEYRPLTFPLEVNGQVTIYMPLTPEAKERLRDTYYYFRPALVIETESGLKTVVASVTEYGLKASPKAWRYWVPYYVYTWD